MHRPRLLSFLALTLLLTLSGGWSARAAEAYPDTPEGAKALLTTFLKPGADLKTMTEQLRPAPADYEAVFAPAFAAKLKAMYDPVWASGKLILAPNEGQTNLLLESVPTAEVKQWTKKASDILPGGYKQIAGEFKEGFTIYRFKFVKPGEDMGMAFDGLIYVNGHYKIFPKAWRAAATP